MTELVNERVKEILTGSDVATTEMTTSSKRRHGGGVYLTYLLSNENITMDEIVSNVAELLLAGTDTVSAYSSDAIGIARCT